MSKYYLDTTGNIIGDRIKIICKMCNRISLWEKDEDLKTKKCVYCGHTHGGKIQSYIDDVPNASSETHIRYSWFCSECEHRGLKWVEKALDLVSCPNCNAPLSSHIIRQINPDKGSCKTIWEPIEIESVGPPKSAAIAHRSSGICHTCGHGYTYRVIPPFRCDTCGETGKSFRGPQPKIKSNYAAWSSVYIDCSACGYHHPAHPTPSECTECGHSFKKIVKVQS